MSEGYPEEELALRQAGICRMNLDEFQLAEQHYASLTDQSYLNLFKADLDLNSNPT